MPSLDLVDETFVAASPEVVARVVHDPSRWSRWWPDLVLTVFMDRGEQGIRWSVDGRLRGSCELWLEPWADGTIVHFFLRADLAGAANGPAGISRRRLDRLRRDEALAWKRQVHALKDQLEGRRAPGQPVTATPDRVKDPAGPAEDT